MTKTEFEYEIKWTRVGKGQRLTAINDVLSLVNKILQEREFGMGAGKITIIQRRVTEERI